MRKIVSIMCTVVIFLSTAGGVQASEVSETTYYPDMTIEGPQSMDAVLSEPTYYPGMTVEGAQSIDTVFPDPVIAEAIRYLTNKNTTMDKITQANLDSITEINSLAYYKYLIGNISNLEGLQYLRNLESLVIMGGKMNATTIAPLQALTKVESLYLDGNETSGRAKNNLDLSPLCNMVNLQWVSLSSLGINDLTVFEYLTNISSLVLVSNEIVDISPLQHLKKVSQLSMWGNKIVNISPLAYCESLLYLCVDSNNISDFSSLQSTPIRTLQANGNKITDISSLASLTTLENLELNRNRILDLSPLDNIPNLKEVHASDQVITLDAIEYSNQISIPNIIKSVSGELVLPRTINREGIYDGNNIIWNLTDDSLTTLVVTFKTSLPFLSTSAGLDCIFSGWIDIPMVAASEPVQKNKVTINIHYADGATADQTLEYEVDTGSRFEQSLDILEGYELEQIMLFSMPEYNIDSNVILIDSVERDYTIDLTFSKMEHRIKLSTKYLDNSQSDQIVYDWIEHQDSYSRVIPVADGYQVVNQDQLPEGVVYDAENHTITISSVTMAYDLVIELEKVLNVTLNIQYEDGAREGQTLVYEVVSGSRFEESLDILEGYELEEIMIFSMPEYNIDSNVITIDSVDRDYSINLTYSKIQYRIKLTTRYLDNSQQDRVEYDWIDHQDNYSKIIQIPEGYKVANPDQLPEGVTYDEANHIITIVNVTTAYDIVIELDKELIDVIITITYEDGLVADQTITRQVEYGSYFEDILDIEEGYQINKIGLVPGVSVNKKQKTITISSVKSTVYVNITAK